MTIHNRKFLLQSRKDLRNNGTSAEALLWSALKNKQLQNRKFRRQHSIENFIVDFYCAEEKLAIELDGQHHFETAGSHYDAERDDRLNELGVRVLRFENRLLFEDMDWVLAEIVKAFRI